MFHTYYLITRHICTHRLNGLLPLPYFRIFFGLIFAIIFSTYDLYWVVGLDEVDRFFLYDSVGLANPCRPYRFPLDPIARSFQSDVHCGSEYPELRDILGPGYLGVFLYAEAEISIIMEASLVDFVGNCF